MSRIGKQYHRWCPQNNRWSLVPTYFCSLHDSMRPMAHTHDSARVTSRRKACYIFRLVLELLVCIRVNPGIVLFSLPVCIVFLYFMVTVRVLKLLAGTTTEHLDTANSLKTASLTLRFQWHASVGCCPVATPPVAIPVCSSLCWPSIRGLSLLVSEGNRCTCIVGHVWSVRSGAEESYAVYVGSDCWTAINGGVPVHDYSVVLNFWRWMPKIINNK